MKRRDPHEVVRVYLIGFEYDSDQETYIFPFGGQDCGEFQELENTH